MEKKVFNWLSNDFFNIIFVMHSTFIFITIYVMIMQILNWDFILLQSTYRAVWMQLQ